MLPLVAFSFVAVHVIFGAPFSNNLRDIPLKLWHIARGITKARCSLEMENVRILVQGIQIKTLRELRLCIKLAWSQGLIHHSVHGRHIHEMHGQMCRNFDREGGL